MQSFRVVYHEISHPLLECFRLTCDDTLPLFCIQSVGRSVYQCDIRAAHDGMGRMCNTVEYATAFLYSDWLYFSWRGLEIGIMIMHTLFIPETTRVTQVKSVKATQIQHVYQLKSLESV